MLGDDSRSHQRTNGGAQLNRLPRNDTEPRIAGILLVIHPGYGVLLTWSVQRLGFRVRIQMLVHKLDAHSDGPQTLWMVDAPENKISVDHGSVIRRFEYDRSNLVRLLALVLVLAVGALWFVIDPRPIRLKSAGTVQVISAIALTVFCWEIFRLILILVRRLPVLVITTRGLIVPRPWSRLKLLEWSDVAEVSEDVMAVVVRPVDRRRLLIKTSIIDDIPSPFRTEHVANEIREARRSFGPA